MTEYYRIAETIICLKGDSLPDRNPMRPFLLDGLAAPDATISLTDKPADIKHIYAYSDRTTHWARLDGGDRLLCYFRDGGPVIASAMITADWREIEIYVNYNEVGESYFMKPLMETLFHNICLLRGGITIHSAAVRWRGNGVAFSAPSGTGKSTQADMWEANFGAEYINGDRPIIRADGGGLYIYGSAWSGMAHIYKNIRAPLTSLVFLEQYPADRIVALNPAEALKKTLPRCFLPYQDKEMMTLAMDTIDKIVTGADCWLLKCTPELSAAELVKKCVMESPNYRE